MYWSGKIAGHVVSLKSLRGVEYCSSVEFVIITEINFFKFDLQGPSYLGFHCN